MGRALLFYYGSLSSTSALDFGIISSCFFYIESLLRRGGFIILVEGVITISGSSSLGLIVAIAVSGRLNLKLLIFFDSD